MLDRSGSDELQEDHLCRVGLPGAELEDSGVSTFTLRVSRSDFLKELVDDELVLAEPGHGEPARVAIALLRERDEPLELGLHRLGLRLGGLDALMVDDLTAEVHEQRFAVRGVARELAALLLVPHRGGTLPRAQPQPASVEG